MRRRALASFLLLLVGAGATALTSLTRQQQFPHERHARLFPGCEACHADVWSGDPYSVTPENCAVCHDGETRPRVEWSGPRERPTNLEFTHESHPRLDCAGCHRPEDAEAPMEVQRASAATCLACHAPEAEGHLLTGSPCGTCHVPLAEAEGLPEAEIVAFPVPPDHGREGFLGAHGEEARADTVRCSICHVQESQESCKPCH